MRATPIFHVGRQAMAATTVYSIHTTRTKTSITTVATSMMTMSTAIYISMITTTRRISPTKSTTIYILGSTNLQDFVITRIMFSGLISYCYDQQSCETMSKSSKSVALKMKVHCKDCGVELKKQLKEVNGVDSVDIDHKLGKVVISGKVDPEKVLRKLEKRGREAELWPFEKLKVNDPPSGSNIVEVKLFDNPRLHNVEVKLTFQGQSTSNNTGITQSKVLPHGGGGRLCSASSSCCGCNHGNTRFGSCYANNRNNYCYHNVPATQPEMLPHGGGLCFASLSCCGGHGGNYTHSGSYCADNRNNYSCHCLRPLPMGYIPHPLMMQPPWSGDRTIPSAPPLPSDYFQPPASPPSYLSVRPSYYSVLSDENTNRCIIQ